jgi:hypothetical protein
MKKEQFNNERDNKRSLSINIDVDGDGKIDGRDRDGIIGVDLDGDGRVDEVLDLRKIATAQRENRAYDIGTPYQGTGKPYQQGSARSGAIAGMIDDLNCEWYHDPTNQVFAMTDSVVKKPGYRRGKFTVSNPQGRVWLRDRKSNEYCVIIE